MSMEARSLIIPMYNNYNYKSYLNKSNIKRTRTDSFTYNTVYNYKYNLTHCRGTCTDTNIMFLILYNYNYNTNTIIIHIYNYKFYEYNSFPPTIQCKTRHKSIHIDNMANILVQSDATYCTIPSLCRVCMTSIGKVAWGRAQALLSCWRYFCSMHTIAISATRSCMYKHKLRLEHPWKKKRGGISQNTHRY